MTERTARRHSGDSQEKHGFAKAFWTLVGILLLVFWCHNAFGASFGNTVTTGSGEAQATTCKALSAVGYVLVPNSNIVIDSLSFFGRSITSNTVYLGIYRWRNNLPTDSLIAVERSLGITGTQWNPVECSLSVSAGDTICVVIGSATLPEAMRINRLDEVGNNQAYTASATLTGSWVNSGYSAKLLCAYAVYHVVGSTTPVTYTATKKTVPK
jgi:hypothetical protein